MGSNFECFVTINQKKHTIIINKDIHYVNFADVYQHICRIDPKLRLSLDSHVFEIFDINTNSFKRLSDSKTLIKCLARIRVLAPFGSLGGKTDRKSSHQSSRDKTSDPKRLKTNDTSDLVITSSVDPQISSKQLFISSFKPSEESKKSSPTQPSSSDHNSRQSKRRQSVDTNGGSDVAKSSRKETKPKSDSLNAFKDEGLVMRSEKSYCELCEKEFLSISDGVKHIQSFIHMKNKREDGYEDIDLKFLTEIRDKKDLKYLLSRKKELKRFSVKEKRVFVKHGIRLKDGFGPESYVCLRCDQSFRDGLQMTQHYNHYQNLKPVSSVDSSDQTKRASKKSSKDRKSRNESSIDSDEPIDLKVSEEVAERVQRLVKQGFHVLPKSRHKFLLKCRFCEFITKSVSKSFKHLKSDEHLKWTTEPPFRGIDRLIVTDCSNTDNEILLARIETVRQISHKLKEEFLSHGLKVKDGFGANAFVCTKCNHQFERLNDCENHLKEFHKLKQSLLNRNATGADDDSALITEKDICFETFEKQMKSNSDSIETLFRNEGIKYRKYDKCVRKQLLSGDDDREISDIYYYCMFCNTNCYSKETAIYHLNRSFHKKIRRGEYMTPIDAMFSVKTDRIDEFDIGFARMEALYRLDNKTKIDLRDKGVRLKDGIGADAYVCLKCNQSIACETIDSAHFAIIRHTSSELHRKFASH